METQATENEQAAKPRWTPEQAERFGAAIERRLDALLTEHSPVRYADWQRRMQERGMGPEDRTQRVRTAALVIVAVFPPVFDRYPEALTASEHLAVFMGGEGRASRAARRNERLLMRLLLRGLKARGEWTACGGGGE